ncbi:MAG: hypothetical protein LBQ66_16315 [Planctomycetaceae bacterium]|nr:hypothetical protein [Planctomycetaceae bacterium]
MVQLHTEAGGTPAFQSISASRKFFSLPRSGEGLERGRPARLCALGNRTSLEGTPRRVGEHLPKRLGVQFQLFWFNYTQRRAGRPRSSPFPLRGGLYNET